MALDFLKNNQLLPLIIKVLILCEYVKLNGFFSSKFTIGLESRCKYAKNTLTIMFWVLLYNITHTAENWNYPRSTKKI